jgi:hypothetical protein
MDGIEMKFELKLTNTTDVSFATMNPTYDPSMSSAPYHNNTTVVTLPKLRNTVRTDMLFIIV